tara:strand:- start:3312 stop:4469 length:1158 start_codon:yes stop_codon:yes gene_type:complete
MATSYTEQVVREDPYTEAYKRGLFESTFDLTNQRLGFNRVDTGAKDAAGNPIYRNDPLLDADGNPLGPDYAPAYQVAGLSPEQRQAQALLQNNLGGFMPSMQAGLGSIQQGAGMYNQAAQLAGETREDPYGFQQTAAQGFEGSTGMYAPGTLADPTSGISSFFNPFEDAVVGTVQDDFNKARRMEEINQASSAIGSGAYGGSRAAVTEQEALRNLNQEELRALAEMRGAGYTQALDASQNAFQQQQQRAQTAATGIGNLGNTYGQLAQRDAELMGNIGSGIATLGQNEAALGSDAYGLMRGDVSALSGFGGQNQLLQQQILDAQRNTNVERQNFGMGQYGGLSDILNRVPTNSSTMRTTSSPQQSGTAQAISYGIAGLAGLAGVS